MMFLVSPDAIALLRQESLQRFRLFDIIHPFFF